MKIKNLNVSKKMISLLSAGALTLSLAGCGNYDMWDTQYEFNKAIIFGDNTATIVEVKQWTDYDGEQIQILTNDGLYITTSSFDTKLIDDRNSKLSAEDIAKSIGGEDIVITYLDEVAKTK